MQAAPLDPSRNRNPEPPASGRAVVSDGADIIRLADLPQGVLAAGEDPASRVYLAPLDARPGPIADHASMAVLVRNGARISETVAEVDTVVRWARAEGEPLGSYVGAVLDRLRHPPARFAGLPLAGGLIMGVINVTPDSFSDGGDAYRTEDAIARGRALAAAGAHILDIGGESTRPGSEPISADEEMERVLPVIRGLDDVDVPISIDTRCSVVMTAAFAAGARIVNDVTALTFDPDALAAAAAGGVPVVLMHMQGDPRTMQAHPRYDHAALDIFDFLGERVEACVAGGIPRDRIAVDPGIGFGKTLDHNLVILNRLALFGGLGCTVLLGVSRKSFIGRLSGAEAAKERLPGSLAAGLAGIRRGARILRVHDVAGTRQALDVWTAIEAADGGP